jgi:hypothetical protein
MKKFILIFAIFFSAHQLLHAQQNNKPTAQQLQAGIKTSLARADYARLLLKNLNITANQKPEVNKLVQEYMAAKQDLNSLDSATYVTRQAVLFNNLKNNLATVLTKEQMTAFMAAKPKTTDKPSFLMVLYY